MALWDAHRGVDAAVGAGRRLEDVLRLLRRWVASGAVDPRVAPRYLRARRNEAARRRAAWAAQGRPHRRGDD